MCMSSRMTARPMASVSGILLRPTTSTPPYARPWAAGTLLYYEQFSVKSFQIGSDTICARSQARQPGREGTGGASCRPQEGSWPEEGISRKSGDGGSDSRRIASHLDAIRFAGQGSAPRVILVQPGRESRLGRSGKGGDSGLAHCQQRSHLNSALG